VVVVLLFGLRSHGLVRLRPVACLIGSKLLMAAGASMKVALALTDEFPILSIPRRHEHLVGRVEVRVRCGNFDQLPAASGPALLVDCEAHSLLHLIGDEMECFLQCLDGLTLTLTQNL